MSSVEIYFDRSSPVDDSESFRGNQPGRIERIAILSDIYFIAIDVRY